MGTSSFERVQHEPVRTEIFRKSVKIMFKKIKVENLPKA